MCSTLSGLRIATVTPAGTARMCGAGENGAFSLPDVPPGKYKVEVWHEKLGKKTMEVEVKGGEDTKVNFELG